MLETKDGKLAPYFIIVSNISSDDNGTEIIKGNERVLRARLSDAQFFFEQDKKNNLESRVDYLKKLTFHEKIGSVYDKMQSVIKLSDIVAPFFNVTKDSLKRSITLSKADLVTNMVKEFPELQGVMGYYYAMNDNGCERAL
jgi:glycyl-tRNA synthetase beta chain